MVGMAERAAIAWKRLESISIGGSRPRVASGSLISSSMTRANIEKVVIRWNLVLEEAVELIGGTKPAYVIETIDGLIRSRVSFSIPLDNTRSTFQHVEVAGMNCLEAWEAESTAASRALYQLEREPFHIKIMDVSRLRCEEMERSCNRNLLKAGEACRGGKLLLSDWEDAIVMTEACYREIYEETVNNVRCGTDSTYGQMAFDAANCIYELNMASYLKLNDLTAESEKIKAAQWEIRARVEHHFRTQYHGRPQNQPGNLPREIKVCMKVVLDEMIRSLRLDDPAFKFIPIETGRYVCEVLLLLRHNRADGCKKTRAVATGEGSCQHDALESACQHAVFLIEDEMSTHLVDMNYNRRLHAEPYTLETKKIANLATSMAPKMLAEWEILLDGVQACENRCWNAVVEHADEEPSHLQYNAKSKCAEDLSDLHGACLSDLVLAKDRHAFLTRWANQ